MSSQREIIGERDDQAVKSCCANVYQSEWARLLLGESFHPGGTALTAYLGAVLRLGPGQRVLDVAAGQGTSAIHLAQASAVACWASSIAVRPWSARPRQRRPQASPTW